MKIEDIEMGVYYLKEIKALKEYKKTTTGYYYQKNNEATSVHEGVISLVGKDCGTYVSIDTKLKKSIAISNREMMYNIEKLVNERIAELEKELDNYNNPTLCKSCVKPVDKLAIESTGLCTACFTSNA